MQQTTDDSTLAAAASIVQNQRLKDAKKQVMEPPGLKETAQLSMQMDDILTGTLKKNATSREKMRMLQVARDIYSRMLDATQSHRRQLIQSSDNDDVAPPPAAVPAPAAPAPAPTAAPPVNLDVEQKPSSSATAADSKYEDTQTPQLKHLSPVIANRRKNYNTRRSMSQAPSSSQTAAATTTKKLTARGTAKRPAAGSIKKEYDDDDDVKDEKKPEQAGSGRPHHKQRRQRGGNATPTLKRKANKKANACAIKHLCMYKY